MHCSHCASSCSHFLRRLNSETKSFLSRKIRALSALAITSRFCSLLVNTYTDTSNLRRITEAGESMRWSTVSYQQAGYEFLSLIYTNACETCNTVRQFRLVTLTWHVQWKLGCGEGLRSIAACRTQQRSALSCHTAKCRAIFP
eukprot:COSAG01_NODE_8637_length_2712_cov_16.702641_2_plen_143_part_00